MSIRILHLSDLHFSQSAESNSYDVGQLCAIQRKYEALQKEKAIDRVIVTGDLTCDAKLDSFLRAKSWLMGGIKFPKGVETGLYIDNDIKLKVMPGNKDFDFKKIANKKFPDIYFDGLKSYNDTFIGNHTFFNNHPIVYDWFETPSDKGMLVIYLNTSFFGDDESNKKLKDKFTDYTCLQIRKIVNKGLKGLLKVKKNEVGRVISSEKFRNSFKVLVSHHSLQSLDSRNTRYIHDRTKQRILSNLGIMDFQVQLSGHNHIYEQPQNTYFRIFDDRARNRFVFNELKLSICGPDGIEILKSSDGRKYSSKLSFIVQLVNSIIDPDKNREDKSIINEIEKIFSQEHKEAATYLKELIFKGVQNLKFSQQDRNTSKDYFLEMDDLIRKEYEDKAGKILKELVTKAKQKTLVNFNAGSAAIPHRLNPEQRRHFNFYEYDSEKFGSTFLRYHYVYEPESGEFELENKPALLKYDLDKIPY